MDNSIAECAIHPVITRAMTEIAGNRSENGLDCTGRQLPGQPCVPSLGQLENAQCKVGCRYPAPEQIVEKVRQSFA